MIAIACAICSGVVWHVALADGEIGDVAIEQFSAVRRLHVLVVRHAAFHFAAQRNAAFRAEAKPSAPNP